MKIKSVHLYIGVAVLAVVFLVFVSLMQTSKKPAPGPDVVTQGMPNDDVHKGMQQGGAPAPSKTNVSPEFTRKMNDLKTAADKNPKDTAKIKEYADLAAEAHKADEAIEYYEKILKVNPRRTDIRMTVASLYFAKQDFTKCEITLNSVLSYDKNNYHAMFNLGIIAATKGDNQKAKNIWNELIKKDVNPEITKAAKEAINSLK